MKYGRTLLFTAMLLISFSLFNAVYGQPTQSSYTVKLDAYTLQVTYPAEVIPGDTVTVNVQGSRAGLGVYLQSLTVTIYYANASGLHEIATENLFVVGTPNAYNNYVSYGYAGSFNKNFTVSVPENASGTLVSIFSETALPKYQGYTPYFPSYPYAYSSYPYTSSYSTPSYPYFPSNTYYPYSSTNPYYPYYPSSPYYPTSNSYSSDQAIAPLSYVKAAPEPVTLQSENQMLQQQLNQTQGLNQQLQTKVSQQSATVNQLSQQLAGANGTSQTYQMMTQMLALALGVLSVILVAFVISQRRRLRESRQTVETKSST